MSKITLFILTAFLASHSFAQQPEIWWATQVECNVFMQHLSVKLNEVDGSAPENSYEGSGMYGFDSLTFSKCKNDDDSISCKGQSASRQNLELIVARESNGTFSALLTIGGHTLPQMGCLLRR